MVKFGLLSAVKEVTSSQAQINPHALLLFGKLIWMARYLNYVGRVKTTDVRAANWKMVSHLPKLHLGISLSKIN